MSSDLGLYSLPVLYEKNATRNIIYLYLSPLFQRARSIVIAEYQHMYYREFLPKLFGIDLMETLGLSTEYQYDPDVDASMANEFLIAYR